MQYNWGGKKTPKNPKNKNPTNKQKTHHQTQNILLSFYSLVKEAIKAKSGWSPSLQKSLKNTDFTKSM